MGIKNFAPILVFAYKRVDTLKLCIESLKTNAEAQFSTLIIYCDGPKNLEDNLEVEKVHSYINSISGFSDIKIHKSLNNKGLSKSILEGISEQFQKFNELIILEDDLVVSKNFLLFMNYYLSYYEKFDNVASIHGYCYPINNLPNTFFIKGADCWGWATWKRVWSQFEQNGSKLLKNIENKNLKFEFNLYGAYNYTKMLKNQINKKNDSWAIRWHASNFLQNKLTLYPGKSLVKNIGMDGNGTNFTTADLTYKTDLKNTSIKFNPIKIEESIYARNLFILFFYKRKFYKAVSRLYLIFKKI